MLKQLTKKFAKEETGAPIIEIVILIAMAAVIAAVLFPNLRKAISTWTTDMFDNIQKGLTGQSTTIPPSTTGTGTDVTW